MTTTEWKQRVDQKLPLVEKFLSVQGEGANAGRAAFFVRFSGCNLDCRFADGSVCDTPWQKAQEKPTMGEVVQWLISETARVVKRPFASLPPSLTPIVILTGGEPTMARAFDDIVGCLKAYEFYVAVESNGTLYRDSLVEVDHLVVSPKHDVQHGPRMLPTRSNMPDPRVLELAHELRYVITADSPPPPEEWTAPHRFVSPALLADGTGVEWQDPEYFPRFAPGAVERCMEIVLGNPLWRMSLQTHKWLRVR